MRMMSYPEGCTSAGYSLCQSLRSGQPAWTAHVMEESNHVSNTSVSGVNVLEPHFGHFSIFGASILGSMGAQSASARIVSPHFLQYHMGIGVAKILWREITQSQSKDLAQSIIRFFM